MQKNKLTRIILIITLTGMLTGMTGCSPSQDPINEQIQQETEAVAESTTQTGIQQEEYVSKETQLQSESEVQTETKSESAAESQTEMESEVELQTEEPTVTDPQMEQMSETQSETEIQQPAAEGFISETDYTVSVKGTVVALQGDMRDYADALGKPDQYSAAKSCIEAGEDKIYTYDGITIYTYITNGADRITLIEITGSGALPSGIHIGSTKSEVVAAYGNGYTEEGTELLYETGGKTLGLQMDGDRVSFIELFGR